MNDFHTHHELVGLYTTDSTQNKPVEVFLKVDMHTSKLDFSPSMHAAEEATRLPPISNSVWTTH